MAMKIVRGNWIIVARNVRDNKTRGQIIKDGMTETVAKAHARMLRETGRGIDYWAMPASDY